MSKEIAQTVGQSKVAWLLAIVAAFAVMGLLATQWRGAQADVTGGNFYLDECSNPIGVADAIDDPGFGLVQAGATGCYEISIISTAAPTAGDLRVIADLDNDFAITSVTSIASNGGVPVCATSAGSIVTCTYPGPMPAGVTANIQISGTINGDISIATAITANDLGSAQAAQNGINQTAATTGVLSGTGLLSKVNNPATVGQTGGAIISSVTLTAPGDATNVVVAPVVITDSIPAGETITAAPTVTAPNIGTPAVGTCTVSAVPVVYPVVGPAIVVCPVTFDAGTWVGGETFTLNFPVTVAANPALTDRDVCNTGATGAVIVQDENQSQTSLLVPEVQACVTQSGAIIAELRHMSDVANRVIGRRDIETNVRNSRHTICAVQVNTGIDLNNDGDFVDANEVAPVAATLPGLTLANIQVTNTGGYATTIDTDPTFSDVRIFIGDGTATGQTNSTTTAGLAGATCISWVSLDAGDQSISIVYVDPVSGLNVSAHWDTDGDANDNDGTANDGTPNTTIIKEWNRLEESTVTLSGGATGTVTGTGATGVITRSIGVTLNPATGLYQFNSVLVRDVFIGSHTNAAGQKEGPFALAGVIWSASLAAGSCGSLTGDLTGVTQLAPDGTVVGGPAITFNAGGAAVNCGPGRTATINFTGSEPGPLGSGTGITVTEQVVFTFSTEIAAKQVFLAWAGQRVILEHDWRIPAGDEDGTAANGPDPLGECPFGARVAEDQSVQGLNGDGWYFPVDYVKGSGPGNFLPSLGAQINGSDHARVWVEVDNSQSFVNDNDIPGDANGSCISRVLFESEDQGQVDIEAFVPDYSFLSLNGAGQSANVSKHAFVIYYMKINTINVSLATQFSKPSHNGSVVADWASGTAAPANPWNASLDDADNATEWNVSKDLLVRGRVTGWFTNTNPSGRARDDSNPLNVLPADRWVMPNDWPLLAGGPADPADGTDAIGTAEQFRPYYDILFAPNNTRGLALTTPEGASAIQVATVATSAANTATAFAVTSCVDLPAGAAIIVGTTGKVVSSCTSSVLTITVALAAAPAAGTPVFLVTGVPFEGPFSLLDIKGLFAEGKGGAALSNWDPGNIRDTSLGDGDVDMWDAPMPPAPVSVQIRGTGFIKQVIKDEIYYVGTPNSTAQVYPNPFYISNIPDSPFIPAIVVGGGYFWDSWGSDGPGGLGQGVYRFWTPARIGVNSAGIGDTFTAAQTAELTYIRGAYGDNTIARDLVVYTDNHGEFMVAANGDFRTDLTACATNVLAGGKHCKPGDKVGTGTITATVDYPDFRGKHFPVLSNAATVDWTWGGYKDVTVEAGETDQFKYIVFHALDRDAFCRVPTGAVSLHPVLSGAANDAWGTNPAETVDFLIDSGEGIIIGQSGGGTINDGKQFATGVKTFSWAANVPGTSGILEFPLSPLAAEGQTDECQAWIKVSNSLLGVLNVLTIAHDDEGNIGFDRIIDLTNTHSYTLSFRWSLITWAGADAISVNDAIKGTGSGGKNPGGNDISASVTAIYGWDAASQTWLGYFPSGVNVPGANDLTSLKTGDAYWIAITGPSSVTWTIASNVN